ESCVSTESRLGAKFDSLMELLAEERLSALATPRAELRAKEAELHGEAARLRAELGLLQEALGVVRQLEETESHVAFIRGFMRDGERLVTLSQSPLEPPVRPGLDFVESSRSEAYVDRMLAFLSGPQRTEWSRRGVGGAGGGGGGEEMEETDATPTLNPDTAHPSAPHLRRPPHGHVESAGAVHAPQRGRGQQPERFHDTWYPQALCSESFASGRHYWEVDVTAAGRWLVGVAYGSLPLQDRCTLGMNSSSWCLQGEPGALVAWHAGAETTVEARGGHGRRPADRRAGHRRGADAVGTVGVYVDWEAGRLSFFGGGDGDSLRPLHSFRAAFSRPLYPRRGRLLERQRLPRGGGWIGIHRQGGGQAMNTSPHHLQPFTSPSPALHQPFTRPATARSPHRTAPNLRDGERRGAQATIPLGGSGFMRDGERLVTLSQSPLEPPVRPGLDFVESSRSEAYVDRMLAFLSGPSGPNGPGEEWGEPEEEEEGRRWRRFGTGSRSGSREGVEAPQLPQLRAALGSLFRRRSSSISSSKEATSRRTYIKNYGCMPTLNPDTAHPRLLISDDLRTATWSQQGQSTPHNGGVDCPEQPERFHDTWYPQALCSESFASGRHYWEVDVTAAGRWLVGVAYGSLPLQDRCTLGMNSSSWCLQGEPGALVAWHAGAETTVEARGGHGRRPADRRAGHRRGADAVGTVGVYVDWEAGRLSFFGGGDGDSLRPLHSFRAAFSRPLYPAVGVFWSGSVYHAGAVGSVSIVKVVDKR
ncbi:unnamed protein product, partial [Lampetra fluviatilis]